MAKKKGTPGRGKKECPGCGEYVGVRVQECECGHKFPVKAKSASGGSDWTNELKALRAKMEKRLGQIDGEIEALQEEKKSVAAQLKKLT